MLYIVDQYQFYHSAGVVYEYSEEDQAYVFCDHLKGRTEAEFLSDTDDS